MGENTSKYAVHHFNTMTIFFKEIMVKLKKTNTINEKHYAIAVKLSVA